MVSQAINQGHARPFFGEMSQDSGLCPGALGPPQSSRYGIAARTWEHYACTD